MANVDELRRRLERIEREIEALEDLPPDDFVDGDAIQFERRFPDRGSLSNQAWYTYVAVKVKGEWYVCGATRSGGRYSWENLATLLASRDAREVWFATGWQELEL